MLEDRPLGQPALPVLRIAVVLLVPPPSAAVVGALPMRQRVAGGPFVPADYVPAVLDQWVYVFVCFAEVFEILPFEFFLLVVVHFGLLEAGVARMRAVEGIHFGETVGDGANAPSEFELLVFAGIVLVGGQVVDRVILTARDGGVEAQAGPALCQ